jgi:sugar lactone lactonase YvrE
LGRVWKIDVHGHATTWLSDPLLAGDPEHAALGQAFGADGIAFDRNKRNLYISNLDFGMILRVSVLRDGSPGAVSVFALDARLKGADGIAFDEVGTLYVAVNAQDRLATVDRRGFVTVLAEGSPLDGPSSLAFGVRRCDRHKLFLTNFAISRASGAQSGTPHPGILSLEVSHKGLPLP